MRAVTARPLLLGSQSDGERAGVNEAGETVLILVSALVFVDGVIHVGAAVDHFDQFPLYTLTFACIAAVQIAWAALLARRPSPVVLLAGCAFTAGVIALWAASRTVGVPIAPRPWAPEPVGVADLIATLGELVTVIAVLSVWLSPRRRGAEHALGRITPLLIAVLLVSVLLGAGAHAG
ncbi:MAG TPA: hypothetical protein VNZ05_00655 [Solirubrobacteraceae bacterium]|nr:hypothetical protein [Solirubrobacteraceae bacterium]